MANIRRSDFDVTNTVQVSSPAAVLAAVERLFRSVWPELSMDPLTRSFEHFERLFAGEVDGFHGVDTVYHDRQHTLDVVLAMARLLVGYEKTAAPDARLGYERAAMGLVTAVFHDAGYIREVGDTIRNGAEYTRSHVTRPAGRCTMSLTVRLARFASSPATATSSRFRP